MTLISGYSSTEAVQGYAGINNTSNSENRGALKYAMGLGMFTNQNYYAGYERFGGEQNSYFTSKNGYTDVVERTREWIG